MSSISSRPVMGFAFPVIPPILIVLGKILGIGVVAGGTSALVYRLLEHEDECSQENQLIRCVEKKEKAQTSLIQCRENASTAANTHNEEMKKCHNELQSCVDGRAADAKTKADKEARPEAKAQTGAKTRPDARIRAAARATAKKAIEAAEAKRAKGAKRAMDAIRAAEARKAELAKQDWGAKAIREAEAEKAAQERPAEEARQAEEARKADEARKAAANAPSGETKTIANWCERASAIIQARINGGISRMRAVSEFSGVQGVEPTGLKAKQKYVGECAK